MNKLTEATLIPVGVVAIVLVSVVTEVMWFSTFAAATTSNTEVQKVFDSRLTKVEEKQVQQNEIMIKDLSRIKDRLNINN